MPVIISFLKLTIVIYICLFMFIVSKILNVLYIIIVIEKLCTYMNVEVNKIKSNQNISLHLSPLSCCLSHLFLSFPLRPLSPSLSLFLPLNHYISFSTLMSLVVSLSHQFLSFPHHPLSPSLSLFLPLNRYISLSTLMPLVVLSLSSIYLLSTLHPLSPSLSLSLHLNHYISLDLSPLSMSLVVVSLSPISFFPSPTPLSIYFSIPLLSITIFLFISLKSLSCLSLLSISFFPSPPLSPSLYLSLPLNHYISFSTHMSLVVSHSLIHFFLSLSTPSLHLYLYSSLSIAISLFTIMSPVVSLTLYFFTPLSIPSSISFSIPPSQLLYIS